MLERYQPERKLPTTNKIWFPSQVDDETVYDKVYVPVPYDINFELSILASGADDAGKILEQILPFFTPEWTVTAKIFEDTHPDYTVDLPVVLNSVTSQDTYDEGWTKRRAVTWVLSFTMQAYFYGPISEHSIIKIAKVSFFTDVTANVVAERVTVQPGLTANGEPTSNISLTIPYDEIDENDDYGYIVTIETAPDDD